jgi:solute carrier family 25 protein 39/40
MSVPNTVLYFTAYDELSTRMRDWHYHQQQQKQQHPQYHQSTYTVSAIAAATTAAIPLIAGSTARLVASLATAPLELVRTRQAGWNNNNTIQQNQRRRGMVEELLYLSKSNGIRSLYSGLAPTLWRDVPFSAIYWLCLERIRDTLSSSHENTRFLGKWGGYYYKIERQLEDIPPIVDAAHSFVSGAIAGSIAAAFTTPFDVVKTRRQIMIGQSIDNVLYSNNDDRRRMCTVETSRSRLQQQQQQQQRVNIGELGTFRHMRHIAQEEGIVGLWKGNVTRILKVAPACAIMISCYEFGKRIFTL